MTQSRPHVGINLPPDEPFWQHNRRLAEKHAEIFRGHARDAVACRL